MTTLRLATPWDGSSQPETVEAEPLPDGRYRVGAIGGLSVLMPGDVVEVEGDVVTAVVTPAAVWAWEVTYPVSWIEPTGSAIQERAAWYRKRGLHVETTTTISLAVVTADKDLAERTFKADSDIDDLELVRWPVEQLDLQALVNERYPFEPSAEQAEHEEWMRRTD